jgi:NADP-dependent 3-hydroxy acid dehydrogenase YdfG
MTQRNERGRATSGRVVRAEATMDVDNVARAVVYMVSLPLDAKVQFVTVMATKLPYVGRG